MVMTVIVNTNGDPKSSITSIRPIQHTEAGATDDVVNEVIEAVLASTSRFTITAKVDMQLCLSMNKL